MRGTPLTVSVAVLARPVPSSPGSGMQFDDASVIVGSIATTKVTVNVCTVGDPEVAAAIGCAVTRTVSLTPSQVASVSRQQASR